jgi:hypothetical protein
VVMKNLLCFNWYMPAAEYTIKNNLVIIHRRATWDVLQHRLTKDFGMRILLSWVSRRELGFTIRKHQAWIPTKNDRHRLEEQIHLDFYDSGSLSWFVLRYL